MPTAVLAGFSAVTVRDSGGLAPNALISRRCHRIGPGDVPTGMTTMPGLLPLARHYYETRRELLTAASTPATPWYRLSADELGVAVAEARIILEAVRRANDEQHVLMGAIASSSHPTASDGLVEA